MTAVAFALATVDPFQNPSGPACVCFQSTCAQIRYDNEKALALRCRCVHVLMLTQMSARAESKLRLQLRDEGWIHFDMDPTSD